MGIITRDKYLDSLRKQKPDVYIAGEKVENVVDNPWFRSNLNHVALTYDLSNDPEYTELTRSWSPLVNEEVSFWTHIRQDKDDLAKMIKTINTISGRHFCTFCLSMLGGVLWAGTYDIDKVFGTEYHERFKEFYKHIQKNDFRCAIGIMDPKGDRSLKPSQQTDPDLYLRIVEKRADGIVVKGAKLHSTSAPCIHYFIAFPCRVMAENEKEYAISFAVPIETKGLTFITRPAASPLVAKEIENPISSDHGFVESLSVFDNVFIPWERVFMCGEWEATEALLGLLQRYLRLGKCACTPARVDILIGAATLISEYNGTEKASHIAHKITEMMLASKIGWGCANGAVLNSTNHPSGVCFADLAMCSAGVNYVRSRYAEFVGVLHDIAGGLVTTMPTEADFKNPVTKPLIEKYLQGKVGTSVENRFRLFNLIQDIAASRFSGYIMSSVICAAGSPETNRIDVVRNYDLANRKRITKAMAKIS